MDNFIRKITWSSAESLSENSIATLIGSAQSSISSLSKREALAFKAGSWAGIPLEIAFENYVAPEVKKRFGEQAFYNTISQFGSTVGPPRKKVRFSSPVITHKKRKSKKMAYKRSYKNENLEKRLKRVEARSKAEMKSITYTISGTVTQGTQNILEFTAMNEGTSVNERIGDKIKVWRIDIRGFSDQELNTYLIQKHGGANPSFTDFTSGATSFLNDSVESTRFTEWALLQNQFDSRTSSVKIHYVHKWPMGIVVDYEGNNAPAVDNGLLLVTRNTTTSDHIYNLSVRMWYTDK